MRALFVHADGVTATKSTAPHEHALRLLHSSDRVSPRPDSERRDLRLTRAVLENGTGGEAEDTGNGDNPLAVLSAALEAFRPDLVMISAGLDGRKGHPCGRGELVAEDYEWLTGMVRVSAVAVRVSILWCIRVVLSVLSIDIV